MILKLDIGQIWSTFRYSVFVAKLSMCLTCHEKSGLYWAKSEEHAAHSACSVSELATAPPREGTAQPRPRPQPVAATAGWTGWTRPTAATAERAAQPQESTGRSRRSCSILRDFTPLYCFTNLPKQQLQVICDIVHA